MTTATVQPTVFVARPGTSAGKTLPIEELTRLRSPNCLMLTYWPLDQDDKRSASLNAPKAKFKLTGQWSKAGLTSKFIQGILIIGARESTARLTITGNRVTLVVF